MILILCTLYCFFVLFVTLCSLQSHFVLVRPYRYKYSIGNLLTVCTCLSYFQCFADIKYSRLSLFIISSRNFTCLFQILSIKYPFSFYCHNFFFFLTFSINDIVSHCREIRVFPPVYSSSVGDIPASSTLELISFYVAIKYMLFLTRFFVIIP